jgi:hypothetical protein
MRFYLNVVNPAIAFIVLILCFWAATYSDKSIEILGIVAGSMNTYFFAKGLFTCSTLLITGRILREILDRNDSVSKIKTSKAEIVYCIAFIGLTISLLAGFLINENHPFLPKKKQVETAFVANPAGIKITESYRVSETQYLMINGQIQNESSKQFDTILLEAAIFIGTRFTDSSKTTMNGLAPHQSAYFKIESKNIYNGNVKDSVTYHIGISAK